jgi:hypothetical protein
MDSVSRGFVLSDPFALWREGRGATLILNKSDGCGEIAADLKVNTG